MNIFPAIDLYNGKAVRLYKGNYDEMTVYSNNPIEIARDFVNEGAQFIHIVDLEGAKTGGTPNLEIITDIAKNTGLFVEVGGGIRSIEVIEKYINAGVNRVILGTAAVNDEDFLRKAVSLYNDKVAVGIDIKDGFVAIKGWTEKSQYTLEQFMEKMIDIGVACFICTDISKDGAMEGTNAEMYKLLASKYKVKLIASGGVSGIDDIKKLKELDLYGAIIGKAYYIKAISLKEAIEVAK
ncbi:MAG: 1-(5-phosphoribosyl)-5-[(5-phosphoribosylamino)methylideneamino]imidazole-4-carboxamide isomerase [Ruminococcaceae bacterium]|nr:1-(5-phosphoribosyl)-5-[(5-phosphoribosylamino)methylideneamino]imidazole-4-carboxamide isomerase [Oscillospiraceae bacterium]